MKYKRKFSIASKSVSKGTLGNLGIIDQIVIGLYPPNGWGPVEQILITWRKKRRSEIQINNVEWKFFYYFRDLFEIINNIRDLTPDELYEYLISLGIEETE